MVNKLVCNDESSFAKPENHPSHSRYADFLLSGESAEARYAAIVIDVESGAVLHETNADTRNHPASLTKMMTLYMLFEALQRRARDGGSRPQGLAPRRGHAEFQTGPQAGRDHQRR